MFLKRRRRRRITVKPTNIQILATVCTFFIFYRWIFLRTIFFLFCFFFLCQAAYLRIEAMMAMIIYTYTMYVIWSNVHLQCVMMTLLPFYKRFLSVAFAISLVPFCHVVVPSLKTNHFQLHNRTTNKNIKNKKRNTSRCENK